MKQSLTDGARAVRDLVAARARSGSQPGRRDDAFRLGLCIEGGAMRGVVSAGMVVALEQLGLLPVFDCIYGSSAGSMNAAFFAAGQAGFGTTIYYEDINNAQFINPRRRLSRRPVVDLDFLVWNVMRTVKQLDTASILESRIDLRVLATSTTSGKRVVFDQWTDADDLLACLRAASSMPIITGPPYTYRNEPYWDALLSEPIPSRVAEEEGCTHLMVLLTRPKGTVGPKMSLAERLFVLPRIWTVSPALARRFRTRAAEYAELLNGLHSGRGSRAAILAVAPMGPTVSKLEQRRASLVAGAQQGVRAVLDALEKSAQSIPGIAAAFGLDANPLSSAE